MLLSGKVAVVTGGTRGIGFAIVKDFLDEGATVVLCGSKKETADRAVETLKARNPDYKVSGAYPTLSDYQSVKNAFNKIEEDFGGIDILVNNAGISDSTPFTSYTEDLFDKVVDLNLKAVYNCSRAVVDGMKAHGHGVILNTSSMVSICGQPSGVSYPSTKFAVNGFTLSLARELGPYGIRVNAVAPGITDTDMFKAVPKEYVEPLIKQIPLRRIGKPEDVANAFTFLASDKASYITGVVLSVDGLARS